MAPTRMGMDADAVENAGRQLKSQAASIGNLISQLDRVVNSLGPVWNGQDAQRFVRDSWPQHKQALVAAQQRVEGLGQSALNNASDQRRASSPGGSGGGPGTSVGPGGSSTGAAGWPNISGMYHNVMDATPVWPISVGTMVSMTPLGDVTPFTDTVATALDPNLSMGDKIGDQAHTSVDVAGGELRQAGWDQHDPALYLSGVAVSQWGDVASEVSKADFSAPTVQQNLNYINSDPAGAWQAASSAVVGYVPKMVSNWTFNPFGK